MGEDGCADTLALCVADGVLEQEGILIVGGREDRRKKDATGVRS